MKASLSTKSGIAVLCVTCCCATGASYAIELYGGGSVTYGKRDKYEDLDAAWGGKGLIGVRFAPSPIFVEAEILNTGKCDADLLPGASDHFTLQSDGYALGIGYLLQTTGTGSGLWMRGGYYDISTELKAPLGSFPDDPSLAGTLKESSNGATLSAGWTWKPTSYFGLRLEIETLFSPKDFANNEDLTLFGIGVILALPAREAPKTYSPIETPPIPAPVSTPSVTPAPAPAPAIAPQSTAGNRLVADTRLRGQPLRNGTYRTLALPAGTPVTVLQTLANDEGKWFYVQFETSEGWIAESALTR
jgi:hypothetical protein